LLLQTLLRGQPSQIWQNPWYLSLSHTHTHKRTHSRFDRLPCPVTIARCPWFTTVCLRQLVMGWSAYSMDVGVYCIFTCIYVHYSTEPILKITCILVIHHLSMFYLFLCINTLKLCNIILWWPI
jgi:hypothetical protein